MNIDDEMQTFLRDGVDRYYVEAKASVTTFEAKIKEQLIEQIEATLDWPKPAAQGGERGKTVRAGLWPDPVRPSIYARTYDRDGNYIELGIEWGTLKPGRPILYTEWPESGSSKLYVGDPKAPVQNQEGYLYWVMDPTIEETDLINRARIDGKGPADGFES